MHRENSQKRPTEKIAEEPPSENFFNCGQRCRLKATITIMHDLHFYIPIKIYLSSGHPLSPRGISPPAAFLFPFQRFIKFSPSPRRHSSLRGIFISSTANKRIFAAFGGCVFPRKAEKRRPRKICVVSVVADLCDNF